MSAHSQIEWTEATWNPVTGCTKISAGCKNCYAERLALRLQAMGSGRYRRGFRVTLHEEAVDLPCHWVIVGGESGPHSRSMEVEWVREIFRSCRKQKVPFFFKQWSGVRKDLTGRALGGRTYDEMPKAA